MVKNFPAIFVVILILTSCGQYDKFVVFVVLTRFPNGNMQEVIFYDFPITKDSIGAKEIYFENGNLQAKGNCKKGKRNGEWICYRENGKLKWRAYYLNGEENGVTECFEENGSWRKMTMVNGKINGLTIEFITDSTGKQVYVYGQYKECKETGLWVWKNKDQKIVAKQFYNNGKLDKFYETYYDNGLLKQRAYLRLGFIDSLQMFDSVGKLVDTKHYKEFTKTYE